MELEDEFIDGNFELPQESEPTAEQEAHPTPKTTKKSQERRTEVARRRKIKHQKKPE